MLKAILLFIFSVFIQFLQAQTPQELNNLLTSIQTFDFNAVQRLLTKMSRPNTKTSLYAQSTELYKRKLISSYEQFFYRIDVYEDNHYKKAYYLNLVRSSKKLTLAAYQDVNGTDAKQWKNETELASLLKIHQKYIGFEPNAEHLYFFPSKPVTVGFKCGYAGMPEPETTILLDLLKKENLAEIKNWCGSLIPEVRCYGMIGLTLLLQKGVRLEKTDKTILRSARSDKTLVDMCKGSAVVGFQAEFREMYDLGVKELGRLVK